MRRTRTVWLGVLALYSLALLAAETLGSVELARSLCTDIVGPIRFFAVNTSLSVSLLLGSALVLLFSASVAPALPPRELLFLRLQAAVFLYLGLDDRFLLHESMGHWLHIDDAFVLLAIGGFELWLLWRHGALATRSRRARAYLLLAAVMFAMMTVIDAGAQDAQGWPRLTLEDLAKTWSAAFLFGFAWEVGSGSLRAATSTEPGV